MNESDFNKAVCKKLLPNLKPNDRVWKIRDDRQGGVPDNFFMIGGHSLLAIRLSSRIAELFDQQLSFQQVFEHNTPRALAGLLNQQPEDNHEAGLLII